MSAGERERLVIRPRPPIPEPPPPPPIPEPDQVSPVWTVIGCILVLSVAASGVIVAMNSAVPDSEKSDAECWACFSFKCAYSLVGCAAICCLLRMKCIGRPDRPGHHPSNSLVLAFVVFAGMSWLSLFIDITCNFIKIGEAPSQTKTFLIQGIIRQIFLFGFTGLQGWFFFKNVCRNVVHRLSRSWVLLSILVGCNLAIWFYTVGNEVQELSHHNSAASQFCQGGFVDTISKLLYPFQIEYCVLSSLMAFSMMTNIFHGAAAGAANHNNYNLRLDLHALQQYSRWALLNAVILLLSIAAAILIRFQDPKKDDKTTLIFHSVLLLLHIAGLFSLADILRHLTRENIFNRLRGVFLTDRILLWLGAAAVLVINIDTIWQDLSLIGGQTDSTSVYPMSTTVEPVPTTPIYKDAKAVSSVQMVSCVTNIIQCVLQVLLLEYSLLCRFANGQLLNGERDGFLKGLAVLNVLITVNASEWLISAFCFLFFNSPQQPPTNLTLLLLPLQIFFRFYSATSIQEFKKHFSVDNHEEPHGQVQGGSGVAT